VHRTWTDHLVRLSDGKGQEIFRKWDVGDVDWIDLGQDGDRWRALVNVVMNLRIS
jgi:hypothetical protein